MKGNKNKIKKVIHGYPWHRSTTFGLDPPPTTTHRPLMTKSPSHTLDRPPQQRSSPPNTTQTVGVLMRESVSLTWSALS